MQKLNQKKYIHFFSNFPFSIREKYFCFEVFLLQPEKNIQIFQFQ